MGITGATEPHLPVGVSGCTDERPDGACYPSWMARLMFVSVSNTNVLSYSQQVSAAWWRPVSGDPGASARCVATAVLPYYTDSLLPEIILVLDSSGRHNPQPMWGRAAPSLPSTMFAVLLTTGCPNTLLSDQRWPSVELCVTMRRAAGSQECCGRRRPKGPGSV
ncbi:hypothetical protein GDO78_022399 [Eleutherodactylus coqui]|uniref:Uncharacterized protein n=1 Tax=Eleutherodactylus coqui TaxID=57060 RepID=A0A8J6EMX1_ELECQ|nr:hypothetical protein GDO78_022399 [Eleutherodactylus coqui]